MKKALLISLIYFLNNSYCLALTFIYNDNIKKEITLKNGLSFDNFEIKFRNKYQDINIPNIAIVDANHPGISYNSKPNLILIPEHEITTINSAIEWSLLHETGHAQNPYTKEKIVIASLISGIGITTFWGKHRLSPYKNLFTKLNSKLLAGTFLGQVIFCRLTILEEQRADNFANKHADKDALIGAMQHFEESKNEFLNLFPENTPNLVTQSLIPLLEFDHPSINCRIAKIKTALKDRFNTEA